MTQEEQKQLLLKDLCSRLPHRVKVRVTQVPIGLSKDETLTYNRMYSLDESDKYIIIKPYLRSMSSMTIEEICKIRNIIGDGFSYENGTLTLNTEDVIRIPIYKMSNLLQFMYQRHLDFNNLIPMGLAIEVAKENNPYKD